METPNLVVVPPTPLDAQPASSPSPSTSSTTLSTPGLTQSSEENQRSSSETTMEIYSMYGDDSQSTWPDDTPLKETSRATDLRYQSGSHVPHESSIYYGVAAKNQRSSQPGATLRASTISAGTRTSPTDMKPPKGHNNSELSPPNLCPSTAPWKWHHHRNRDTSAQVHRRAAPLHQDLDSFHVRSTYAQLDVLGVKGDGIEEGVERTRARIGSSRESEIKAANAIGDEFEKRRDLSPQELQMLASLDRYGFFSAPSHDRLVLLPTTAFLKPLSRIARVVTSASAHAATLHSLPQSRSPIREAERMEKWGRMLEPRSRDVGGNIQTWGVKAIKQHKLSRRAYKGIPDRWRSAAWLALIGNFARTGKDQLAALSIEYREALEKHSPYDIQIDLDVPRTINGHVLFRTRYGLGQRSLFHVLHSFSLRCDQCGYCQGMGPIAAMLLCYFAPERAYASLVHLHDAYHMHDIFSPGFPGLLESIYVQERVIEEMMPTVYMAFKKHTVSTTSYATKWYITLFANSIPFQTHLRLWDGFLLEGPDLFVIVAVSIIWAYRDHITAETANFETVLSLLSSFFVPEEEDVYMDWIAKVAENKKIRSEMQSWRAEWKELVASGRDGDALL
ncbi:rab-GTPase-TBC domain-containing protein [Multifurca ochricompacta]|uniref:Rab-GTPase-TBC domain-containing protein n=1 Tax=Multifurca ochricompacta TaxID=376703 RepID=A0AAD4QQ66_9AGAM|nr:rab-GTPase-TBC domain-containing protein [Multifurca ochricompacta]